MFHILIEDREKLAISWSKASLMHTFQDYVRVSYGTIHVMSYVLKANTVGEVVLELITGSYY